MLLAPYALPGELARVTGLSEKRDMVRGRVGEILEPSPERITPRCPYFGRCGGCQYQHASETYQSRQKVEILREVLRRIGKLEPPAAIGLIVGPPWNYRNRIQLHFDGGWIGFREQGSHKVVGIEHCDVASPRLNEAVGVLREMMGDRRWPRFLRSMELFTNEREVQLNVLDSGGRHLSRSFFEWCAERLPGAMSAALSYPAAGSVFRVSHKSFFQVNRFLTDRLVDLALESAGGETALDLYAGVGLFTVPLGRRFRHVTAIEAVASAVHDLEYNARALSGTVTAVRSTTESYLERLSEAPEFVLADPPRAGLGRDATRHLNRLKPKRLTVISCDPSTLARDLAELCTGGYAIVEMTLVDMFPQTAQIETVVKLARQGF